MPGFVVYKLGGSLLTLPDLAARLRAVWARWPGQSILIVVGGGAAADVVREWDAVHRLGPEVSHWLAIDSLDLSARLLETLMPELRLVRSRGQMQAAHAEGRPALLCVRCFMKWLETQPDPLPHGWEVTSDSIAAAVTRAWDAERLVLLKSLEAPSQAISEWISQGAVDGYFAQAARKIERITWINLRSESLEVREI